MNSTTTTKKTKAAAATSGASSFFFPAGPTQKSSKFISPFFQSGSMTVTQEPSSAMPGNITAAAVADIGSTTQWPIFGQFPGMSPASMPSSRATSSARRLNGASMAKPRTFDKFVTVSFKHGTHYKIDRPLVEMMIQNQMFAGLRDDQGSIYIQEFSVEEPGARVDPVTATGKTHGSASKQSRTGSATVSNTFAILCTVSAALVMMVFIKYRPPVGLVKYKRNLQSAPSDENESPLE